MLGSNNSELLDLITDCNECIPGIRRIYLTFIYTKAGSVVMIRFAVSICNDSFPTKSYYIELIEIDQEVIQESGGLLNTNESQKNMRLECMCTNYTTFIVILLTIAMITMDTIPPFLKASYKRIISTFYGKLIECDLTHYYGEVCENKQKNLISEVECCPKVPRNSQEKSEKSHGNIQLIGGALSPGQAIKKAIMPNSKEKKSKTNYKQIKEPIYENSKATKNISSDLITCQSGKSIVTNKTRYRVIRNFQQNGDIQASGKEDVKDGIHNSNTDEAGENDKMKSTIPKEKVSQPAYVTSNQVPCDKLSVPHVSGEDFHKTLSTSDVVSVLKGHPFESREVTQEDQVYDNDMSLEVNQMTQQSDGQREESFSETLHEIRTHEEIEKFLICFLNYKQEAFPRFHYHCGLLNDIIDDGIFDPSRTRAAESRSLDTCKVVVICGDEEDLEEATDLLADEKPLERRQVTIRQAVEMVDCVLLNPCKIQADSVEKVHEELKRFSSCRQDHLHTLILGDIVKRPRDCQCIRYVGVSKDKKEVRKYVLSILEKRLLERLTPFKERVSNGGKKKLLRRIEFIERSMTQHSTFRNENVHRDDNPAFPKEVMKIIQRNKKCIHSYRSRMGKIRIRVYENHFDKIRAEISKINTDVEIEIVKPDEILLSPYKQKIEQGDNLFPNPGNQNSHGTLGTFAKYTNRDLKNKLVALTCQHVCSRLNPVSVNLDDQIVHFGTSVDATSDQSFSDLSVICIEKGLESICEKQHLYCFCKTDKLSRTDKASIWRNQKLSPNQIVCKVGAKTGWTLGEVIGEDNISKQDYDNNGNNDNDNNDATAATYAASNDDDSAAYGCNDDDDEADEEDDDTYDTNDIKFDKYFIVEALNDETRFALPGDSGSMVSAMFFDEFGEHNLYYLAILFGGFTKRDKHKVIYVRSIPGTSKTSSVNREHKRSSGTVSAQGTTRMKDQDKSGNEPVSGANCSSVNHKVREALDYLKPSETQGGIDNSEQMEIHGATVSPQFRHELETSENSVQRKESGATAKSSQEEVVKECTRSSGPWNVTGAKGNDDDTSSNHSETSSSGDIYCFNLNNNLKILDGEVDFDLSK